MLPDHHNPNIQPYLNDKTLDELDIKWIENKPEAPWIKREQNGVVFTDNMIVVDGLKLDSETSVKKIKKKKKDAEDSLIIKKERVEEMK